MLEGARAVVTGGAGFIASHIVERLAARNEVVVLDVRPAAEASNVAAVKDRITYVHGDVRRADNLARAFRDADVVFHLAALVSVPQSFREPGVFNETNTHGTLAVLRAARAANVRRVVYASSCAVYGTTPPPLREDSPLDLLSPYAVTKAAGEMWCRLYHELGLEAVALRLFNVYGPRQPSGGPYGAVIPNFLRAVTHGERPVIYGDGEQTRDFVYVGDAAEAFDRAATAAGVSGEVINVGSGEPVSVNRLLATVNDVVGTDGKPEHREARAGDIRASYADPRKGEALLGFRTRVSLPQGLLATAEAGIGRA
ncbi:MAG: NAD-dependent epimerase/dehydratase family protein [Euryarchaeota archaeon]|nr:NAD-dependent epimerase/dehydratase family protein [Euryarchaeota archaeon]